MAFSLEKEALAASGVVTNRRIKAYTVKLDHLLARFIEETSVAPHWMIMARDLFNWLWIKKPFRYESHGNFKLDRVIDAQIDERTASVGNCLGLTLLYHCLLQRLGVESKAIFLEHAFGIGPHVLTLLEMEKDMVYVENIFPHGFGYRGHAGEMIHQKWGDRELVADIFNSLGNSFFDTGNPVRALENYNRALDLNPYYEQARINRAVLLDILVNDGFEDE